MPAYALTLTALLATAAASCALAAAEGPVTLEQHVRPVLKQYCYDCHNAQKQKGDLNLEPIGDNPRLDENRDVWEKVAEALESGDMPPEKKPQPTGEQREMLVKFVDGQLSRIDCKQSQKPGKVTIRRLNREEYKNTIRDLLGLNYRPEDFPNDEVGYGFDNIGDVLSLPPMLMEKYLAAAEEIVGKVIVADPLPKPQMTRIKGEKFGPADDAVRPLETGALGLYREGEAMAEFNSLQKGEYIFRVRAHGEQAGLEPPKLALRVGGKELTTFDVPNQDKGAIYEARAPLEAGAQRVAVAYLNNYVDQNNPDPKLRGDRNLFVEYVEIEGPPIAPKLPESHMRLITRMPQPGEEHACAKEILGNFARRAYRRPVSDAEVERLTKFVDLALIQQGSFIEGISAAVQAALCSPHFLYRWELDPDAIKLGEIRALTDYEVASRLSYFLWSSMPDAQLFALAEKGELRKDGNLEKQVARMLQDWRAHALVSNFASQWLQTRGIYEITPEPDLFPNFDVRLREAMKQETELFFEAVMKEDRPVTELIDADFTFLNERLAKHYGIDGVKGNEFQRVKLPPDSPRGGVLTQGSVLLVTSTPTRTAPVIRGKWILEEILGTPPPPPPPDVPPLKEQNHVNQSASLRQRLEEHRNRAECASCHSKMDPLGFALENFDATGRWRDQDGKFPIDASGTLSGGKTFNGPRELKELLKNDKRFVRCLTEKMMIYALGRGLDRVDKCAVDAVVEQIGKNENRFSALVTAIVTSDPFLKRETTALAKN